MRKEVKSKRKVKRERTERKEDRGVKPFSQLARPLTSSYAYQCGLGVWAHLAPSAAITLGF